MRCARYIINWKREYRSFTYGYEIELLEGNLVTEEVYTSHKFDITEFRSGARKFDTYSIFESHDAAETYAKDVVAKSKAQWVELGKLFEAEAS